MEALLPRWHTFIAIGKRPQLLADSGQKASGPHCMDLPTRLFECPCDMAVASLRESDLTERTGGNHDTFHDLATYHHFCHILLI